ncbi:hypothetical protein [Mesorhizobium sp. B2-8-3]|uniref:hypothetical protein n=1 Tax=Mesorhizobium sp. B2-8-3 TaxID=2589905 RepID=UPI00112CC208|nr:hypothetical protein [Mesorhizobium sp. B2-8-3]TPJ33686.1 hypothetical protein FJ418_13740 [Mesorhizobium sp. B2-8-3]
MPGTIQVGGKALLPFIINQTDLLAGTSFEFVAPFDGFLDGVDGIVQAAIGTGGTLQVINKTTNVAGAVANVANAAAKGTPFSAKANDQDATRPIKKGERIQLKPTGFATSGAVNGYVTLNQGM